jgi:hypothetical protein
MSRKPAVGRGDVMTDCEHEVIYEDLVEVRWRCEVGKQGFCDVSKKCVRVADGWPIAQLVDSRSLGLVGDGV